MLPSLSGCSPYTDRVLGRRPFTVPSMILGPETFECRLHRREKPMVLNWETEPPYYHYYYHHHHRHTSNTRSVTRSPKSIE